MSETVGIKAGIGDLHEDLTRDLFSSENVVQGIETHESLPSNSPLYEENERYQFHPHHSISYSLGSLGNLCGSDQDIFKEPDDSRDNDCDLPDDLLGGTFEKSLMDQMQAGEKNELHSESSDVLNSNLRSFEMAASSLTNSENSISAPTVSGLSTIPSNSCSTPIGLCDVFGDISPETSAPLGIFSRPIQPVLRPCIVPRRVATKPISQPTEIIDLTRDDDSDVEDSHDNPDVVKDHSEEEKSDTFLNAILDGADNTDEEDKLDTLFNGVAVDGENRLPVVTDLVPSLDKVNAVLGLQLHSAGPECTTQNDASQSETKKALELVESPCSEYYDQWTPETKKQTHDSNETEPVCDATSTDVPQLTANQQHQTSDIDAGLVSNDLLDKPLVSLPPPNTSPKAPSKPSCSKPKKKSSPTKKKKLSKREAARAASAAEQARQREIALLAKTKQISDDELLRLKPKKQRRAAKFDKPIPSRFCHVCSRTPKNVRLAVCCKIKEGICRKVICEKCFEEFGFGDFEAALETGTSSWCCPHCSNNCPGRAQCRTYQRINDRLRVNRLKQEKPKGRKRGRRVLEEGESSGGGGREIKKARFLLPGPGGMENVAMSGDMILELGIERAGIVGVDGMGARIEGGGEQNDEGVRYGFGVCDQERGAGETWNGPKLEESEEMWGVGRGGENEGVGSEGVSTDTTVMMGAEEEKEVDDDMGKFGNWVMGEMDMMVDCKEKGNVELKGLGGMIEGGEGWEFGGMMAEMEGEGKLVGYF